MSFLAPPDDDELIPMSQEQVKELKKRVDES
jgi:hypothetical protein